jgi:hypothetical protein
VRLILLTCVDVGEHSIDRPLCKCYADMDILHRCALLTSVSRCSNKWVTRNDQRGCIAAFEALSRLSNINAQTSSGAFDIVTTTTCSALRCTEVLHQEDRDNSSLPSTSNESNLSADFQLLPRHCIHCKGSETYR